METDLQPQSGPVVVIIAGVRTELELPTSYAERWEVTHALQDAAAVDAPQEVVARLLAGALGVCCPRLRRFLTKERAEYSGDLRKFGQAVIDFHAKQKGAGLSLMAEILAGGRAAHKLCRDNLLEAAQLQAAGDFSQAPAGSSSSNSSRSSSVGAETQDGSARSIPGSPQG